MPNTLLAGDHHLFHTKIIEYGRSCFSSVEEHNEVLIDNHNNKVRDQDIVYFMGDVCLSVGSDPSVYDILKRFRGRKRLIIGNHDTPERIQIYHQYFEKIYAYHSIGTKDNKRSSAVLSHMPIHPFDLSDRYKFNIHAHLHQQKIDDPRYICVSLDQIGYTPISLDELREKHGI